MERMPTRILKFSNPTFDMEQTFTSGQCFRWNAHEGGGRYIGVVGGSILCMEARGACGYEVAVYGADMSDAALRRYLSLDVDYAVRQAVLARYDAFLKAAVASSGGIHLLRQDPFETLIAFILSGNNNIPKIKMSLEALCERFGEPIGTLEGRMYYAMPTAERLYAAGEDALSVRAIGYRKKAVYAACERIVTGKIDLEAPLSLSYELAREWFKAFYGVGDKIANCIVLFAYGKEEAFPVDTWVKKLLKVYYGVEKDHEAFIKSYFLEYPGYAQQLLFAHMRSSDRRGGSGA